MDVQRVGLALVGAIAWAAWCLLDEPEEHATPKPPAPPKHAAPLVWKIAGNPIALRRGVRYRGCVSVPWPASIAVSVSAVKERAEKEGFTDVYVADDRPRGWSDVDCKQYVEATWGAADRTLERPGVIRLAWESST